MRILIIYKVCIEITSSTNKHNTSFFRLTLEQRNKGITKFGCDFDFCAALNYKLYLQF